MPSNQTSVHFIDFIVFNIINTTACLETANLTDENKSTIQTPLTARETRIIKLISSVGSGAESALLLIH